MLSLALIFNPTTDSQMRLSDSEIAKLSLRERQLYNLYREALHDKETAEKKATAAATTLPVIVDAAISAGAKAGAEAEIDARVAELRCLRKPALGSSGLGSIRTVLQSSAAPARHRNLRDRRRRSSQKRSNAAPHGSSALYCRSPKGYSMRSPTATAPAASAVVRWASASATRTMIALPTRPACGVFGGSSATTMQPSPNVNCAQCVPIRNRS